MKQLIILLLCVVALGCIRSHDLYLGPEKTELLFNTGITLSTKATSTNFEEGDTIKLLYKARDFNTSSDSLIENCSESLYTLRNGEWYTNTPIYYPGRDSVLDIYGVYPHYYHLTDSTIEYTSHESDKDMLVTSRLSLQKTSAAIDLLFFHKMSQVIFMFEAGNGIDKILPGVEVILQGVDVSMSYYIKDDISKSFNRDTIVINSSGLSVVTTMPPQALNNLISFVVNNHKYNYMSKATLNQGESTKFTIRLNRNSLNIATSIQPWAEGEHIKDTIYD